MCHTYVCWRLEIPKKSSVILFGRIVGHRTICNAGTAINVCDVNPQVASPGHPSRSEIVRGVPYDRPRVTFI